MQTPVSNVQRRFLLGATPVESIANLMLVALLVAISAGVKLSAPIDPQDEGILLTYPDLILRGYLPYRDFAAIYPPGTFYVIAGAFHIFGETIVVERFVAVGYHTLLAITAFVLGRTISWPVGSFAALASQAMLLLFTSAGAYSMLGAIAFLMAALLCAHVGYSDAITPKSPAWSVLAGLSAGCMLWFRYEVGIVGVLAVALTLRPRSRSQWLSFSLGFLLPLAGLLAFVLAVGPAFAFDSLVMDVLRAAPGRSLPIRLNPIFVLLMACMATNVGISLAVRTLSQHQSRLWLLRGISVISVGLLPSVLQRADMWHVTYIGALIMPLTVLAISIFLLRAGIRPWARRLAAMGAGLLALLAMLTDYDEATLFYRIHGTVLAVGNRWVYESMPWPWIAGRDRSAIADASSLLNNLSAISKPEQRVFVGPRDLRFANLNDTYFYFLLPKLRPASRYLETNPGGPNHEGSRLADEIESADWIIQTSRYDFWHEPNESTIPGPSKPNEVVSRKFCVHSTYGVWRLMRRCR